MTFHDNSFSEDVWQELKNRYSKDTLIIDMRYDNVSWIKKHIEQNYLPEEVFTEKDLIYWAVNNGYVLKSDYESIIKELQEEIEDYRQSS